LVIDGNDLRITLAGTDSEPGEIDLLDLAAIGSALQELSTRVGREWADRSGPGRTADVLTRMTRLRLTALSTGSTVLHIGYGSHDDVLPFDEPVDAQVADLFWEVLEGLGSNERPGWSGSLVAQSAVTLNRAFERAAARVTIERTDRAEVSWSPSNFARSAWLVPEHTAAVEVSVTGHLDAVDLTNGHFRIVDDAGQSIEVEHVGDPVHAAQLIGQRVVVIGTGTRDRNGQVRHLDSAVIDGPILPTG
jgi:hypothetical protein